MKQNSTIEITLPTLIFSITGRCLINPDADDYYRKRVLEEIKQDLLYKHVFQDISRDYLDKVDLQGEGRFDYDPILYDYIVDEIPDVKQYLKLLKKDLKKVRYYQILECIPNRIYQIPKIPSDIYKQYYDRYMEISEHSKNKTYKKSRKSRKS